MFDWLRMLSLTAVPVSDRVRSASALVAATYGNEGIDVLTRLVDEALGEGVIGSDAQGLVLDAAHTLEKFDHVAEACAICETLCRRPLREILMSETLVDAGLFLGRHGRADTVSAVLRAVAEGEGSIQQRMSVSRCLIRNGEADALAMLTELCLEPTPNESESTLEARRDAVEFLLEIGAYQAAADIALKLADFTAEGADRGLHQNECEALWGRAIRRAVRSGEPVQWLCAHVAS